MNSEGVRTISFCRRRKPPTQKVQNAKRRKPARSQSKKKNTQKTKDILEIHEEVLNFFDKEYEQLESLQKRATRLKWIIENSDMDSEIQVAKSELDALEIRISLIQSGIREAKYIHKTEHLLEEYREIMKQTIRVDFVKNRIYSQKEKKENIIAEYLNIAKEYIHVQQPERKRRHTICKDCNIEMQRDDDYLFVCGECGNTLKYFASMTSYQENNRINVSQRYVYDKRVHFGDSIKKYQAKQNTTISDKVYRDIYKKIENHDIPIDRLTKDHIYEFLKLTGHSDHYEDITLIYCEITKTPPPDISHLEQELFRLFDEIDPVYERVKPEGRMNFLNGQFVLFKCLQKLKYPCREEDFYILKTRDKMLEHDQIWKRICNELSWTYIATV